MKIIIKKEKGLRVEIKGHAGYAEAGKDIVCAGVSAIFYMFLNYATKTKTLVDFKIKDGDSFVEAEVSEDIALLLMVGLQSFEDNYPECVQIEKEGR